MKIEPAAAYSAQMIDGKPYLIVAIEGERTIGYRAKSLRKAQADADYRNAREAERAEYARQDCLARIGRALDYLAARAVRPAPAQLNLF